MLLNIRPYLLFICCCFSYKTFSQTAGIDSLKRQINFAKDDKERLNDILALCQKRHSLSTDTLYKYASLAKGLSVRLRINHDIILSDYYYTNYLIKKGSIDSAIAICDKYISGLKNNKDETKQYLNFVATRAALMIKKDQYKEAFAEYYRLLNESEEAHDSLNKLLGYTGLGWVNMEMDNNRTAVDYLKMALNDSAAKNPAYGEYISFIYSDIAAAYNSLHIYDSAEYFINKAIPLANKFENLTSLANCLAIKADIMSATGRNKEAENALVQVVEIRKKIGDPFFIVSDMSQLAVYYEHNNQPQKGIAVSLEGIDLAKKNNLSSKLILLYDGLARNYYVAGDFKNYGATLQTIIALKDSLYKKNSAEALAEIEGKYEMQKKENIIMSQHFDLVKKNFWIATSLLLAALVTLASVILFRIYRRKQRLRLAFMMEEEKRLAAEAVTLAEEKERKRIAADLHDNMGAYATAIIANVEDVINNKKPDAENIYGNLKINAVELMSNLRDTIWASNTEKILLTGIADRFKNYLKKIMPAYSSFSVETSESIKNDISFSPVQALNIFRILQEATTNALKHSNGSKIDICFGSDHEGLRLTIRDNGTGIKDNNYLNNGNGIKNMKARATESNLSLSIEKNTPSGTILTIFSAEILHT
ncbi:MAG TPA: ATP-binding protein [Chitinophagaceae bacterium]|nr:ATP-binding protein [Chitinophagaceae bacterium]